MTQPKISALEVGLQIKSRAISYVNFHQTEFKPINKRQFETSEVMRISITHHVISK
jgi:hypothetical protein